MKKKILALALVLCLLASVLPTGIHAAESSGSCGDRVSWTFDASTGTLTLSGSGATDRYDMGETPPWDSFRDQITTVKVGSGITVLGYNIFRDCTALTTLELPEGLGEICSGAFRNCTALTTVILPESMHFVGGNAFRGSGLTAVIVSGGLEDLGPYAFADCTALQEIWFLGDAPDSFGDDIFAGCTLYALYPDGNDTWNEYTLLQYGGTVVWMRFDPETGEPIPDEVYWGFDETTGTLYIEGTGPVPGFQAEQQPWYDLREQILHVVVGEGITEIGNTAFAFGFINLQTLTLPSTLMRIGNQAFLCCTSLQNVTFPRGLRTIGWSAFQGCNTLTEVILPDSVTALGGSAFLNCAGLERLTLPAGLVQLGTEVFGGCKALTSVTMPEMPNLTTIGDYVFSCCYGLTSLDFYTADTIGKSMFSRCRGLTEVTIPECVTNIGDYALFGCENMTKVVMSTGLRTLGKDALYSCTALEQVVFTGNAPLIGEDAFGNTTTICYYPENGANWTEEILQSYGGTVTWIPYNTGTGIPEPEPDVSGQCGDNVTWGFLEVTGTLTISGTGSTWDYTDRELPEWKSLRNQIRRIVVKPGVTHLGDYLFGMCDKAETVTLSDGLQSFGVYTFWNCSALTEVVIPQSVTDLGEYIFRECSNLQHVTLPTGITKIPTYYFHGSGLTSYVIPDTVTTIGKAAFRYCENLESIQIPSSVTTIEEANFFSCGKLTSLQWPAKASTIPRNCLSRTGLVEFTIPVGVTTVGNYAFAHCRSLEKLYVLGDVTSYGTEVFDDCPKLTIYGVPGSVTEQYAKANGIPFAALDPAGNFTDVPSDAFYAEAVKWAVEKEITKGIADYTFGPERDCTRAQVVTFLWRAAGKPAPVSSVNPFIDVAEGDYYYDAVLWAVENEITNGLNATEFGPDKTCTRGQVVTFLWRAKEKPAPASTEHPFTDVTEADYFYDAVLWAVEHEITNGLGTNTFGPAKTCTRGQVVTFLYRTYAE